MADDPYRDPDLVMLYDLDNPGGPDHDFYRGLADAVGARTIVDFGCGTGLLTRSLVARDRRVTGIDPSATMLDFARSQPGADLVHWIHGDADVLPDGGDVDLVVCTGNAIQHISDAEMPHVLGRIAGALRPGGVLAFESRNPAARAWERWTPEATLGERQTPFGRLREWLEVTHVDDRRVVFEAHNFVDGGPDRVYTSELYFRSAKELRDSLRRAGFGVVDVGGDWNGGPVTDASRVLVVRAVRGG